MLDGVCVFQLLLPALCGHWAVISEPAAELWLLCSGSKNVTDATFPLISRNQAGKTRRVTVLAHSRKGAQFNPSQKLRTVPKATK